MLKFFVFFICALKCRRGTPLGENTFWTIPKKEIMCLPLPGTEPMPSLALLGRVAQRYPESRWLLAEELGGEMAIHAKIGRTTLPKGPSRTKNITG